MVHFSKDERFIVGLIIKNDMVELKYILKDYFIITKKMKTVWYEITIPLSISVIILMYVYFNPLDIDQSSNFLPFYGILVAFTTAMLSIVSTSSSENIIQLKNRLLFADLKTRKKAVSIDGVKVSLYKVLVVNISVSLIFTTIFIIVNLFFIAFALNSSYNLVINSLFISYLLCLNLKSTSYFYLTVTKVDNEKKEVEK